MGVSISFSGGSRHGASPCPFNLDIAHAPRALRGYANRCERIACNSLRYLGLAQFRTGQRHKACVGVVEGKTRDNT
jgi:hypothetical protein